MAAGIKNFLIERGNTWSKTLTLCTGTKENPQPINLTGYSVTMEIRLHRDDVEPVLTLSIDNGKCTFVSASNGKINFLLSPDSTLQIPFQEAYYKISTLKNGFNPRWLEGKIIIG